MYIGRTLNYLKHKGVRSTVKKISERLYYKKASLKYIKEHKLSDHSYELQSDQVKGKDTLISICVPLYNPKPNHLRQMLDSVMFQSYGNWELCIADGSDKDTGYSKKIITDCDDERIKYHKLDKNHGISGNSNLAVKYASGNYIVMLDQDDCLSLDALYEIKAAMSTNADIIYSDEASFIKNKNKPEIINFKGNFSIYNLRGSNFICHLCCFKKALFLAVGGFRSEFDGSQDHDLLLRMSEKTKRFTHIPKVLYYWRMHKGSVASGVNAKPYVVEAGLNAVKENIALSGYNAEVTPISSDVPVYRVKYIHNFKPVIIKDFSKIEEIEDEYIIVLKKGVKLSKKAVDELCGYLTQQDVGVVGALLVSDKKIQSAGLTINTGTIRNVCHGYDRKSDGYMHTLKYAHNVTAVGESCFAVRRSVVKRLGGFDLTLNGDERIIDFCLRLREFGYSVIINPYARAKTTVPKELELSKHFKSKWVRKLAKKDKWLRDEIY